MESVVEHTSLTDEAQQTSDGGVVSQTVIADKPADNTFAIVIGSCVGGIILFMILFYLYTNMPRRR